MHTQTRRAHGAVGLSAQQAAAAPNASRLTIYCQEAPISMDTLAPVRMELVKVQHMPPPPPPVGQVCGTQSSVQWRYGAVAQSCNTVCSPGGLSCDLNALATHSRTAECTMALAAQFSVSCNENHLSSGWSGRPSFNGGNNNCYYATTGASLDCTTTWSDISRFCPCS